MANGWGELGSTSRGSGTSFSQKTGSGKNASLYSTPNTSSGWNQLGGPNYVASKPKYTLSQYNKVRDSQQNTIDTFDAFKNSKNDETGYDLTKLGKTPQEQYQYLNKARKDGIIDQSTQLQLIGLVGGTAKNKTERQSQDKLNILEQTIGKSSYGLIDWSKSVGTTGGYLANELNGTHQGLSLI